MEATTQRFTVEPSPTYSPGFSQTRLLCPNCRYAFSMGDDKLWGEMGGGTFHLVTCPCCGFKGKAESDG